MIQRKHLNAILLLLLFVPLSLNSRNIEYKLIPAQNSRNINVDVHPSIQFTSIPQIGKSGKIRIYDVSTGLIADSLDISIPSGLSSSRSYSSDCDYTKSPYDYRRDFVATNKNTRPGTPSGEAEPTSNEYQLNIIGGFTDAFHFHPIIVRGNKATIYFHNNMLEYGKKYRIVVDKSVFKFEGSNFKGISVKDNWCFTIKKDAPANAKNIKVAADGSGDFNTLQGALDFIPDFSKALCTINVKAGDYEEIVYTRNKSNLLIKGEGMDKTILHYANNEVFNPHPLKVKTNEFPGTFPSRRAAVMFDNCSDVSIENLTAATDLKGQAEGLLINGERIKLTKVHIVGSGDALQANGTIYMDSCEMDGGGDTILGRGSIFAYRCNFRNDGGAFTWVRNTKDVHGDVFVECTFSTNNERLADFGRTPNNHGKSYPYAECVMINCKTKNIEPIGWSVIGETTSKMYEYNTRDLDSGNIVDYSGRHALSRQLRLPDDKDIIESYMNPAFVLNGWNPKNN